MKKILFPAFILIVLFPVVFCSEVFAQDKKKDTDLIQIAILLDVSNSMDGLINQAKSQLWKIVNEFALARRKGKIPYLEVALYEYGKSSLPSKEGYLRQVTPLTTDLDKISEELFELKTNGGEEYCGTVIKRAVTELNWSKDNSNVKVIFIAGNEPFSQGRIDYKKSCKESISKGIVINTIFCGDHQEGINTKWKDGADLADGMYANIDQDQKIVHINAPQDDEITRLGAELNKTYISYGSSGRMKKARQAKQDMLAGGMAKEVMVQRSVAKASKHYRNESWDLVDAAQSSPEIVENLKDEELPEEMRGMNEKERKEYIDTQAQKRNDLQKKINRLNEERRKYVAKERSKMTKDNTFDRAIISAIRKQAEKKKFIFEK